MNNINKILLTIQAINSGEVDKENEQKLLNLSIK